MAEESLPVTDDVQATDQGQTEQELLDAVMRNSPIMEEIAPPLPEEEELEADPAESIEEDPEVEEVAEDVEEEVETEEEYVEGEDAPEEGATQEPETYDLDELEDFSVMVKIDGEEQSVSVQDLVKGYTTDASLSKKGRELGEARKELEAERETKLQELDQVAQATNAMLLNVENALAKQYHDLETQIDKARRDGDTFELSELKDKREQAQKNYWNARKRREGVVKQVQEQKQKRQEEMFQQQIEHFHKEIPDLIPDFNEDIAMSIREFAIDEGIAPESLDMITDPVVIKFIDDYRRLKQGVKKGAAKRKAVPRRSVPTKKAAPPQKKKQVNEDRIRAKAFSDDATRDDHDAFLKQLANRSLSNL